MGDTGLDRGEELTRELYQEHGDALLSYVVRLMHGAWEPAEDIVQETLLRAWNHRDQLAPEARRPWLFTTARHLVIDAYRARRARPPEQPLELVDPAVGDEGIDTALDAVVLADALQALSPEHRSVLFDCYYRGRTAAQIAAARGLPPGTVRSRIHYALRALRLALQERGLSST